MKIKGDIKVIYLENDIDDTTSLPQNVIGVEILRKTSMQDVIKVIETCGQKSSKMCGYITFSK